MRKKVITLLLSALCTGSFAQDKNPVTIRLYPDSIANDISKFPLGINLDYFMDDDQYLKPQIRTADALKNLGVKYLRYPGGNKSDCYLFSKPPYDKSDPHLARTGRRAVGGRNAALNESCTDFKNDVLDFDEFIAMCREVGAEPVVTVAADEYGRKYPEGSTWSTRAELLENAVEWVRYSNIKKGYAVKYWMLANETWVTEKNPYNYANDVIDFAKAMKAVDSSIMIIPNGNMPHMWEAIFTTCREHIDAICTSNYPINITDTVYTETFYPVGVAVDAIKKYGHLTGKKDLKIIVAEFGPYNWGKDKEYSFINNQYNNLINFEMTGEQLMEPYIEFSCFWNTRWIDDHNGRENGYDALDKNGNLHANGYGLKIWGDYHGDKMVKNFSTSDSIKAFASLHSGENRLFVYLYNRTDRRHEVKVDIPGYSVKQSFQVCELAGKDLNDQNPAWVTLKKKISGTQKLPGATIRVVEYLIKPSPAG